MGRGDFVVWYNFRRIVTESYESDNTQKERRVQQKGLIH
jgi:hypothetical protein